MAPSAPRDEVFRVEAGEEVLTLKLEKRRARFDGPGPATRYRFATLGREPLPEDAEPS